MEVVLYSGSYYTVIYGVNKDNDIGQNYLTRSPYFIWGNIQPLPILPYKRTRISPRLSSRSQRTIRLHSFWRFHILDSCSVNIIACLVRWFSNTFSPWFVFTLILNRKLDTKKGPISLEMSLLFVDQPGLEPGTSRLWVCCSNQLSYLVINTLIISV